MKFSEWEPIYTQILRDFSFDPLKDMDAAIALSRMLRKLKGRDDAWDDARRLLHGKDVSIVGGYAPGAKAFARMAQVKETIIAADWAVKPLMAAGLAPDIILTDLDGPVLDIIRAGRKGSIIVVHAHGDNLPLLCKHVPRMKGLKVAGTCQCIPVPPLRNFGGFTDGDRAFCMVKSLGAASASLWGFDYGKPYRNGRPTASIAKKKKLLWAKKIIELLR